MKFTQLLCGLAISALAAAQQEEPIRACAAPTPDANLAAVLEDAAQPPPLDPNAPARIFSGINVDTYVHLVTDDTNANMFPPEMVDEQVCTTRFTF